MYTERYTKQRDGVEERDNEFVDDVERKKTLAETSDWNNMSRGLALGCSRHEKSSCNHRKRCRRRLA